MSPVPSMPTHNVTAGQDRLWMLLAVVNDRQAVRRVTVHGAEPPGPRSPPPSPPGAQSLGPVGSPADYPLGAGAATVRGAAIDRRDGPSRTGAKPASHQVCVWHGH